MTTTLRFLGATDTVTGSRTLITTEDARVLIDCGLFQGYKNLRERNWLPFPVPPESLDAVIVTHAHLDHTGYLPALVRDGFRGPILATEGTTELSRIILPDSARLLQEQAEFSSRHHSSRHRPPKPLYTEDDAANALQRFSAQPFEEEIRVAGLTVRFRVAGHILGAAQLAIEHDGHRIHFTGDLGRTDDPLMRPPSPLEEADTLVCESTYGNRVHPKVDATQALGEIVRQVCGKGGVVLLPAFAVGRAETLLLHLSRLRSQGRIPDVPVYLNSPMAVSASEAYARHPQEHRIGPDEFAAMYRLATLVRTVDESKLLNLRGGPCIIISASGMLEGGRILHHVAAYGPGPRNAIVLTGFQAGGTRGAALQAGDRVLRVFGKDVTIRAQVHSLEMLSAHADSAQILDWMRTAPRAPETTFLNHGEPDAADALRIRTHRSLGWTVKTPRLDDTYQAGRERMADMAAGTKGPS